MKKFIRYLQDQAVQASQQKHSGSAYLSPPTKEPQQRQRHHTPSQYKAQHTAHHQTRAEHPSSAAHSFPAHTSAGAGVPIPRNSNGQRDPSPPAIPDSIHRAITRHQYAFDNILQSYELYIPELDASHLHDDPNAQRYWVLYIHGGYFRDPAVTSSSFYPALTQLVSQHHGGGHDHDHHHLPHPFHHDDNNVTSYIAGYASINYRLSPHVEKAPQDPTTTPEYELRTAKWPDHLHDVLAAIAHLQQKYGFGNKYLLVGHSVGATMAVLATLARRQETFTDAPKNNNTTEKSDGIVIEPPLAVLGVSGIYDFPLLHATVPAYVGLTRNAIPDPRDDVLASPARYSAEQYINGWVEAATGAKAGSNSNSNSIGLEADQQQQQSDMQKPSNPNKRALILAHSRDDGLVDWTQVEAMQGVFRRQKQRAEYTDVDGSGSVRDGDNNNTNTNNNSNVNVEADASIDGEIAVRVIEIHGQHNDIWTKGTELARVIREGVRVLKSLES